MDTIIIITRLIGGTQNYNGNCVPLAMNDRRYSAMKVTGLVVVGLGVIIAATIPRSFPAEDSAHVASHRLYKSR